MTAKVKIYVDNNVPGSIILSVDTNIIRVDNTNITVDAVTSAIPSEYKSLDLFKDETISVTSTLQDISDISKTFMDYSKSFNVPASRNNKKIFTHWENNKQLNGFDGRKRVKAYITLSGSLYRFGVIQLEKCVLKEDRPDTYTLTFFGNLLSLKDIFNGLLLKDLTTLPTNYIYTGTNVLLSTASGGVSGNIEIVFPLISSLRNWQYGTGDDISVTPIDYKELFPALSIRWIFKMIEAQFKIKFKGNFMNNPKFTNAYLWLKNVDNFKVNPLPFPVVFNTQSYTSVGSTSFPRYFTPIFESVLLPLGNILGINVGVLTSTPNNEPNNIRIFFDFKGSNANNIPYSIQIFRQNTYLGQTEPVLYTTINAINTSSTVFQRFTIINTTSNFLFAYGGKITFKILSEYAMTFTSVITAQAFNSITYITSPSKNEQIINQTTPISLTGTAIDVSSFMPEMKVEDFFTGLLKTWNLTCYGSSPTEFTLETINDFYGFAKSVDLTTYIKTSTIEIDRIKWYKRIAFSFQKGASNMQSLFQSVNGRQYGDLSQSYEADGSEFKIEVPFEKFLFENLGKPNLVVAKSLTNSLQPYVPKPLLLYDLRGLPANNGDYNIKVNNGAITYDLLNYVKLGNEYIIGSNVYSLNWGEEASITKNISVSNSLYFNGYVNYLLNLFDKKARLIKVSCDLPLSIAYSLKLSNRILIKDKRYLINSFTTDLTTTETKLELLEDFRDAEEYGETMFFDDYQYQDTAISGGTPLVGQGVNWFALNGNLTDQVVVRKNTNQRFFPEFLDYRGTNVSNYFELFEQALNPQSVFHKFKNIRTGLTYFSFIGAFEIISITTYNVWNRFFSVRTLNGTTDFCNLFIKMVLVSGSVKYKFGLSETDINTPNNQTILNYSANTTSINYMLFVLKHSEPTNYSTSTLDLFVFDNFTGQYNDSLLPNLEPANSDVKIFLTQTIIPEVVLFHQPKIHPCRIAGNRISNIWDIKF